MNTDKIYAESIAKDYAPKEDSKIIALKKLEKGKSKYAYEIMELARQISEED